MKKRLRPAVLALGAWVLGAAVGEPQEGRRDAIGAARIRGDMRFLAHDLLEGRGTGTRGYDVAAAYVAARFEGLGLDPLESGSYFQEVPLRRVEPLDSALDVQAGNRRVELEPGRDFVIGGHATLEKHELEAPIVFVGYGIRAPELGHDDYDGIDVRGKIVAFLDGVPESLPEPVRGYFQGGTEKRWAAMRLGAVGAVSLMTPESEKVTSWRDTVSSARAGWLGWSDGASDLMPPSLLVAFSVSGAETLARAGGLPWPQHSAAARDPSAPRWAPGLRASVRTTSRHSNVRTRNVVGILQGRGPSRDQYVVYTAHLDHMGVGEPVGGDAIYNGAVDNASGVAALLWIAEAFTRLPTPPARSIVFLATTAEEPGLFGSDYFVRRGPIPRNQIVAALNIDGATLMVHPLRDVSVMGASNSTLGEAARSAGRRAGLRVHPADLPLLGSDHFPFAKAGIPALWAIAGHETGRADLDGAKLQREWMETRLHTPKDDMSQPLDFQAAADLAAFDFELGRLIADDPRAPIWNADTVVGRFLAKRYQEGDCWQ